MEFLLPANIYKMIDYDLNNILKKQNIITINIRVILFSIWTLILLPFYIGLDYPIIYDMFPYLQKIILIGILILLISVSSYIYYFEGKFTGKITVGRTVFDLTIFIIVCYLSFLNIIFFILFV